jgi:dTDP-4-dehydrorhamnose 3,5-epimerase-like enzyme
MYIIETMEEERGFLARKFRQHKFEAPAVIFERGS